jgi:hypothetical protein
MRDWVRQLVENPTPLVAADSLQVHWVDTLRAREVPHSRMEVDDVSTAVTVLSGIGVVASGAVRFQVVPAGASWKDARSAPCPNAE